METDQGPSEAPALTFTSAPAPVPCPFCSASFKRLGCHLPNCKERGDSDYAAYLSRPPPSARRPSKRTECQKCHRWFRRLDTHLRVSAVCKDLSVLVATTNEPEAYDPTAATRSTPSPAAAEEHLALPHASLGQPRGQKPHRPLKLPKTTEEWAEADHLLAQVTPVVTACVLGEDKSNILASQIYHILSERFGTRSLPRSRKRSQGQLCLHNRALKKVTFLKNAARQDSGKPNEKRAKKAYALVLANFSPSSGIIVKLRD